MVTPSSITVSPGHLLKTPNEDQAVKDQPVSVVPPTGLCSILIPCCGQLEYTKLCVPTVLKYTRQPFELIFLDIGSLDGTAEYLAGIAAATQIRVEIVRVGTDLGIAQGVQDATKQARGEFVVLLNNDTIVTRHWLNQLVGVTAATPAIGLVGPMSNYAAPPQLVENVPYRIGPKKSPRLDDNSGSGWLIDTSAVDEFATKWREEHKGKWIQTERLGGFCLLIKREVFKRIGHLREWSDLAIFDTDILGSKARQAGFTLACCRDLFVHHFGTRTFAHGAPKNEPEKAST